MHPSGAVVTVPGRNRTFTCFLLLPVSNTQLQNVSWLLNGLALENYGLNNIITKPGPGGSGTLTFINLSLENNHTTIQCQATLQSGAIQSASEGILLLQGISYMRGTLVSLEYWNKCLIHDFGLAGPHVGEVTVRG